MNPAINGLIGLGFVLVFFLILIYFWITLRRHPKRNLREIPAFERLSRSVGLAVEAGQRMHVTLGWGGLQDIPGASALVGLSVLQRVARAASISDRPPVATSGEALVNILSQDTERSTYRALGAAQNDPLAAQLTGLTPFSYAAGTMMVASEGDDSAVMMAGHFGSEVALITEAAERKGNLTLGGSDFLPAQAVLYAAAREPLVGEELYASGAYVQAGPAHLASLRAQDILRWVIIVAILAGFAYRLIVG